MKLILTKQKFKNIDWKRGGIRQKMNLLSTVLTSIAVSLKYNAFTEVVTFSLNLESLSLELQNLSHFIKRTDKLNIMVFIKNVGSLWYS